mmetsp:Transcript_22265/g.39651  ORF Transcript_22265/g.39651 Transcript_22265/m.39651 type:complete len:254 (-) Transcript_22265:352-1113(-)
MPLTLSTLIPNHDGGIITALQLLLLCVISAILFPFGILIYRIVFPTILSFPWSRSSENSRGRKREKEMTVVFAGSFNPPHWGHFVMIRYLAERYGRVICCIGVNPNKVYDVTPQTRAQILREMLSGSDDGTSCKNVQVEVVTGYIWRYAKTQNASLFFRGIRTWSADGPEEQHLQILNTWGPVLYGPLVWPLKTVFLEGDPRYRRVSSTLVREICADSQRRRDSGEVSRLVNDESLSRWVPQCVVEKVVEAYG